MSTYYLRLLELRGIENIDNKYYLKVNFTFKETVEIFLETDKFTAKNLKDLVQFNTNYKYRLSFKNFYDSSNKQYTAMLTKTFRDESQIMEFLCSEAYINILTAIKGIKDIDDLDKFSFVLKEPSSREEELEPNQLVSHSKEKFFRFSFVSAAIISIVSLLVFGYIGNYYLNKTYFKEGVLAESIELNIVKDQVLKSEPISYSTNLIHEIGQGLYKEDELDVEETSMEASPSVKDGIPFIELENTITYNLPEGKVALTFDDGPSQYTKEIIDILKSYGVGGTFFLVGYNVEKYPDYVDYIHSNGYSIGSHSINHFDMSILSYEKQEIELIDSIDMLREIVHEDVFLFRPPYGAYNNHLIDLAIDNEYKLVLWNNDPEDWKTRNPDRILEAIKNTNTSGAIILLHESQAVIDALPKIIKYLQEQGLEIVNLK